MTSGLETERVYFRTSRQISEEVNQYGSKYVRKKHKERKK